MDVLSSLLQNSLVDSLPRLAWDGLIALGTTTAYAAYRSALSQRSQGNSPLATVQQLSTQSQVGNLPLSLFRQAIAHSANGLIICDAQQPALPIVYASPSFEELTGYTPAEALGKSCCFLQAQDTQQARIESIRSAVSVDARHKLLLCNYRKDGGTCWHEVTFSALVNTAGEITHYVGTHIDISHYLETFQALQESESRYRHLYEETPAMLHSVDSQGRIVSVSHDWLEKLGYQQGEVIGQHLSAFLADESQPQVDQMLLTLEANIAYRDQPCQFIKKTGERMDVLLSTIAECDDIICSSSALSVLVDITDREREREKLRRSEALLRAINNLPPTGIFVMDCQTNEALFINSEFYRIWQLEHLKPAVVQGHIDGEQLLSECLSNIDLGTFVSTSTAQDFTAGNKIIEDEVPLLDGRTLRRIYGPIQENHSTFAYLYVFEDITERKQAVQTLASATATAETANRAKSDFLANMSHELRSPLNAILGFTHILKESPLSAEQKEKLEIIYNSGEHLLALINDILDISKIEAGRVTLSESEFDLYRLLDELQQMFYSTASTKGLQLKVERSPDLPRIVYSDRLKLRQILINLLSNALKFTAAGTVTLSAIKSAAQKLTFAVTDTGFGIAADDQARLFDAFVQTESGLNAHEGTGLGLAISREYVHLLGGELAVTSALGKGSTFAFDISVTLVETAATINASYQSPAVGRVIGLALNQPTYRILVVDDVDLNRKLLTYLLSNAGFEVREVINGKEAIAQWKAWRPHLIWMDLRMSAMSGEEATQAIKALDVEGHTRIIALTASVFDDNRAAALASGCDDFVSKPVRATEIFEKIEQHLNVRYQYAEAIPKTPDEPITPALLAQVSGEWKHALTQATLDLDDEAILALVEQLPPAQQALARTIEAHVKNLAYQNLLNFLQEAEAVMP
ncbi:MAG: PAS domain S-box protein [Phormidesmis sp.]